MMTDDDLKAMCDALRPAALTQLLAKLRLMGAQYAAGQASRGGSKRKHYLEEAADELDRLYTQSISRGQEIADLRNVVQAACTEGGLTAMAAAWEKYFPEHPISINAGSAVGGVKGPEHG